MGVLATQIGVAIMIVSMWVFQHRITLREERLLSETQGESYRAYLGAVPRLIPSPWPRLPSSGARPRLAQALRGEAFMWGFALAMGVHAATLATRPFFIALGISFIGFLVLKRPSAAGGRPA
jgi:hypothetical protein